VNASPFVFPDGCCRPRSPSTLFTLSLGITVVLSLKLITSLRRPATSFFLPIALPSLFPRAFFSFHEPLLNATKWSIRLLETAQAPLICFTARCRKQTGLDGLLQPPFLASLVFASGISLQPPEFRIPRPDSDLLTPNDLPSHSPLSIRRTKVAKCTFLTIVFSPHALTPSQ